MEKTEQEELMDLITREMKHMTLQEIKILYSVLIALERR